MKTQKKKIIKKKISFSKATEKLVKTLVIHLKLDANFKKVAETIHLIMLDKKYQKFLN